MALTREFKETVMEMCRDPEFRKGLLVEAIESYLDGDVELGNAILRDYLNATQSFGVVAEHMGLHEASLRRMLSPNGNATVKNFFKLFKACQEQEGVKSSDDFLRLVA